MDTLKSYDKLKSRFSEEQARTLVEALPELVDLERLATKDDLEHLRLATREDLQALRTATRDDIQTLQTATKEDLQALRTATKDDIQALRLEMAAMENRLIRWVVGSIIGLGAFLAAMQAVMAAVLFQMVTR